MFVASDEEKDLNELLIEDLCPRLPYGVKGTICVEVPNGRYDMNGFADFDDVEIQVELLGINVGNHDIDIMPIGEEMVDFIVDHCYTIEDFTPILRPMDSMTAEEQSEYDELCFDYEHGDYDPRKVVKWLNKNMFDHNNIMEKLK